MTVPVDEPAASAPAASLRLDDVGLRRPVIVIAVDGDDALAERLRASGLWADAEVEVVGRAPFGDPLMVALHGYRLALRRGEAARVAVREPVPAT